VEGGPCFFSLWGLGWSGGSAVSPVGLMGLGGFWVAITLRTFVRDHGLYDVPENAFILPDKQDRGTAERTIPILPPATADGFRSECCLAT
jgi:hypothetical protein